MVAIRILKASVQWQFPGQQQHAATESQSRQQKYVNQKTVIETITVLPITLTLSLVVSKGFINMITVRNRKPRIDIGIFLLSRDHYLGPRHNNIGHRDNILYPEIYLGWDIISGSDIVYLEIRDNYIGVQDATSDLEIIKEFSLQPFRASVGRWCYGSVKASWAGNSTIRSTEYQHQQARKITWSII